MGYKKRANLRVLLTIGLLCSALIAIAQETIKNQIIEDYIEDLEVNSEDERDIGMIYEDLQYYLENPLNVNKAGEDDLRKLYVLNDFQINSLIGYREDNGSFLSLYELQLVYGFDLELIKKLSPFIRIGDKEPEKIALGKYGHHQLTVRYSRLLEKQEGYRATEDTTDSKPVFQGSPAKLYTRYSYRYKDKIFGGITAEKDPGEDFFQGSNRYGYDFYSFHVMAKRVGIVKTIAIGDYQLGYGQGLVVNTGFSMGKSPEVINLRKYDRGITPYTSTDENRFMRGVTATFDIRGVELSGFYSRKRMDANFIGEDTLGSELPFSSFINTGIHATSLEIKEEDIIIEQLSGGNISLNKKNYRLGVTYLHSEWSGNWIASEKPYKQFIPGDNSQDNAGLNYHLLLHKAHFFGEVAMNHSNGWALINGCLFDVTSFLAVSIMYRNFRKDYYASYGNGFAESSGLNNETGTYMGIQLHPFNRWILRAYYDYFRFPWLKYNVDAPSYGYDYFIEARFNTSDEISMYWRFKQEKKQVNIGNDNEVVHELGWTGRTKFRYHIIYQVSSILAFNSRIELTEYMDCNMEYTYGFLAYQDILCRPVHPPVSLSLRYCIFDAENYDTRIYTYEHDVMHSCSMPSFFNKGSRFYLVTKYEITRNMDVWLKYSQTFYADRTSIGTGSNKIDGNTKSEIKLQVRYTF